MVLSTRLKVKPENNVTGVDLDPRQKPQVNHRESMNTGMVRIQRLRRNKMGWTLSPEQIAYNTWEYRMVMAKMVVHVLTILFCFGLQEVAWNPDAEDLENDGWTINQESFICMYAIGLLSIIGSLMLWRIRKAQHANALLLLSRKERKIERRRGYRGRTYWLELFVCLVFVPPGLIWYETFGLPKWASLFNAICLCRLYWVVEVCRVRSLIWQERSMIADNLGVHGAVNTFFFIRYYLKEYSLKTCSYGGLVLLFWASVVCGWFERSNQPTMDLRSWGYLMCIVFTSVGLGDIAPLTWLGRSLTVVVAFSGVMFLTCCVGFLFDAIELSDEDDEMRKAHAMILANRALHEEAAKCVQRCWREYRKRKEDEERRETQIRLSQLPGAKAPKASIIRASVQAFEAITGQVATVVEQITIVKVDFRHIKEGIEQRLLDAMNESASVLIRKNATEIKEVRRSLKDVAKQVRFLRTECSGKKK